MATTYPRLRNAFSYTYQYRIPCWFLQRADPSSREVLPSLCVCVCVCVCVTECDHVQDNPLHPQRVSKIDHAKKHTYKQMHIAHKQTRFFQTCRHRHRKRAGLG
jgi:hypothetical protein